MTVWLDAQLPPQLAVWIKTEFATETRAVRDLGMRDAIAILDRGDAIVEIG